MSRKQPRNRNIVGIQAGMTAAFKIINTLDLDYFIQALENDLVVSPFKNPMLYKMKGKTGAKWLRLAQIMKKARDDTVDEFRGQTVRRN